MTPEQMNEQLRYQADHPYLEQEISDFLKEAAKEILNNGSQSE